MENQNKEKEIKIMPYAKNLKEAAYGRDLDDRSDVKWAHPELAKW